MRTVLWCFGGKEEAIEKSKSQADAICFDLEDTVPQALKAEARMRIVDIFRTVDFGKKLRLIRVNSVGSEAYYKDLLNCVAHAKPEIIKVPKCETAQDVLTVDAHLSLIEAMEGIPYGSIAIHASVETPLGIRNTYEIASACARVQDLGFGAEDISRAMNVPRRYRDNELDCLYLRQKFVNDVLSAGKKAYDACLLIDDLAACEAQDKASRQMGFSGRSTRTEEETIAANRAFSPSREELRVAQGIVDTYDRVAITGGMPIFEGKMICLAAYRQAKGILAACQDMD